MIDDTQNRLNKKLAKKEKLTSDHVKDEAGLEKAKTELARINTAMQEHQKKMKKEVIALIKVKDQALNQVEEYAVKIEDLVVKFAEEKENLALSLSDRLSKHKIASMMNKITHASDDISSIKSEVKISFKNEIAELNSTLQRIKKENKELKGRNKELNGTVDALKKHLDKNEDKIQTKELKIIIEGSVEKQKEAESPELKRDKSARKVINQLKVPGNKNLNYLHSFQLLDTFNTEEENPLSQSY